jgi:hypothetical protein
MWVRRADYTLLRERLAGVSAQVFAKTEVIKDLIERVDELKAALIAERKRSDNAVDRMLNVKHLPAVTPPDKITLDEISSMFDESPEAVAAIHKAIAEQGIEEVLLGGPND